MKIWFFSYHYKYRMWVPLVTYAVFNFGPHLPQSFFTDGHTALVMWFLSSTNQFSVLGHVNTVFNSHRKNVWRSWSHALTEWFPAAQTQCWMRCCYLATNASFKQRRGRMTYIFVLPFLFHAQYFFIQCFKTRLIIYNHSECLQMVGYKNLNNEKFGVYTGLL